MAPSTSSVGECPNQAAARQTYSLAGLAMTLLLIVIGLYLTDHLRAQAAYQDCILAGHPACDPPTADPIAD